MEKDGLEEMAVQIHRNICSVRNCSYYDGSGSIGRRYARADEIGVPWAITVDHESLEMEPLQYEGVMMVPKSVFLWNNSHRI